MDENLIKLSDFIKFCKEAQIAQKSKRTLYRYFYNDRTPFEIKKIGKRRYITKESFNSIDPVGYKNFKKFLAIQNKNKKVKLKIAFPQFFNSLINKINPNDMLYYIENSTFIKKEIKLSTDTYYYLKKIAKQQKLNINSLINQLVILLISQELNNQLK